MIDREESPFPGFTTSSWSPAGIATLHAVGHDERSALEAGLRAVLALAAAPPCAPLESGRAAPIRGEGDDLGSLFADLIQDLLSQIEFFGNSLHDIAVDGVLRREDGGYIGWGYASGPLDAESRVVAPRLHDAPSASASATQGIVLHATLHRP